jgi:predicted HTH transcriptional regulator
VEFKLKSNHPEKIIREMVAFANSQGGKLIIGVADDKQIMGLKYVEEDLFLLEKAIKNHIVPNIEYQVEIVKVENGKDVLIFDVPKSALTHSLLIENEAKIYVRSQDQALQANKEMKEVLKGLSKNKNYSFQYGDKENLLLKYLDQAAHITPSIFAKIAQIKPQIASRTLVLLTLAGVLRIEAHENEDFFYLIN